MVARRGKELVATAAAFVALAGACGTSRPPVADDGELDGGRTDAGSSPFQETEAAAPTCQTGADGGPCGCAELSLLSDPPNLYFVLDRSGSMNDGGKWQTVRNEIAALATHLGPRAKLAAAVFPDPSQDDCAPGVEVMAPRQGDSPAGKAGPTTLMLIARTNVVANGGTPTAATLTSLTSRITQLPGRTFVILATDGGPNCNSAARCDIPACIPNIESEPGCAPGAAPNCCTPSTFGYTQCLDAEPTVTAVTALATAKVPTYVIGVPGSGPYADLLDRLADAGGTARTGDATKYYRVDSTDAAAFAKALAQVAAKITATCDFTLSATPANEGDVNVYFDDVVVPQDATNGWTIDGAHVTLVGDACARVMNGDVLNVRIIAGCPTVKLR